jgi:hypothetical protein
MRSARARSISRAMSARPTRRSCDARRSRHASPLDRDVGRVGLAGNEHAARDGHGVAGQVLDRHRRLAAMVADVEEQVEAGLRQARLRRGEPQAARRGGQPRAARSRTARSAGSSGADR